MNLVAGTVFHSARLTAALFTKGETTVQSCTSFASARNSEVSLVGYFDGDG